MKENQVTFQLLLGIQSVKQNAKELETIYRQHASAVYRFAWGLCGNQDEAEDLVSETFVRLLIRAPRIRTRTALAYLLAIARNTYLTRLRKTAREVPMADKEFSAPESSPVQWLDQRARLELTLRELHKLPEGDRTALLLRVDHNLPYDDIASTLGISVGAAKVRVHRARARLSSVVKSQGD